MFTNFAKKVSTIKYPGIKRVKAIPIAIFIAVAMFIVYFLTSSGNTPYNYFTRLANSMLAGKYYLIQNPPWLSELIPIGQNRFAVPYPPGPAILLIPFVYIFGKDFPQQIFAHLIGAGIVVTTGILAYEITKNKQKVLWMILLAGLGNIIWFMSSVGSVWFLGQLSAVFFIMLAILILQKKQGPVLIGSLVGIAFLCRVEIIFCLPFFFFLLNSKERLKFLLVLVFFVIFYLYYNFLRFGNFLETGYNLIPGVLKEPWYSKGIINYSYIPRNLAVMFTSIPVFKSAFPYVVPSWGGLAIEITTPAFIYSFFAPIREKSVKLAWLSILLILLIITMHGETGYAQFGYRFAVDVYPFLFFLIIKYLSKNKLRVIHFLILFMSIIVNFWGVIFINKLGFVAP